MTERDEHRAKCIKAMKRGFLDRYGYSVPDLDDNLTAAFDSLHGLVNVSHVHWKFWRLLITSRDLTNAQVKKP